MSLSRLAQIHGLLSRRNAQSGVGPAHNTPWIYRVDIVDEYGDLIAFSTGFAIAPDAILCAWHAIDNHGEPFASDHIRLRCAADVGPSVHKTVVRRDLDLAILRIHPSITPSPLLWHRNHFSVDPPHTRDLPLATYGYESSSQNLPSRCSLGAHATRILHDSSGLAVKSVQITGGVPNGFSGAPVVYSADDTSVLVGVITRGGDRAVHSQFTAAASILEWACELGLTLRQSTKRQPRRRHLVGYALVTVGTIGLIAGAFRQMPLADRPDVERSLAHNPSDSQPSQQPYVWIHLIELPNRDFDTSSRPRVKLAEMKDDSEFELWVWTPEPLYLFLVERFDTQHYRRVELANDGPISRSTPSILTSTLDAKHRQSVSDAKQRQLTLLASRFPEIPSTGAWNQLFANPNIRVIDLATGFAIAGPDR